MDKKALELIEELEAGDLGLEARKSDTEQTDDERMLIALSMAAQAALVQLVIERVLPIDEQVHYMTHLQDFAARLYAGEDVAFKGQPQTFRVDSRAGEVFLEVTKTALKYGKVPHAEDIGTVNTPSTQGDENVKPTLH